MGVDQDELLALENAVPTAHDRRRGPLPNVVLTPHNAGMTREGIEGGLQRAVENIENFLRGAPTDVIVRPATAPSTCP